MSKVSMSSRPEPGYENMDHFSINVDYVAEMLRTIEFQTGDSSGTSTAWGRCVGLSWAEPCSLAPGALCGDVPSCTRVGMPQALPHAPPDAWAAASCTRAGLPPLHQRGVPVLLTPRGGRAPG